MHRFFSSTAAMVLLISVSVVQALDSASSSTVPAGVASAPAQYTPSGKPAPLYKNWDLRSEESPIAVSAPGEILQRVDARGTMVQVRTASGLLAWVRAADVVPWKAREGMTVDLGEGLVTGRLDNPSAVYIFTDITRIPPEGFEISRDLTMFVISDNIDRESLERRHGEHF